MTLSRFVLERRLPDGRWITVWHSDHNITRDERLYRVILGEHIQHSLAFRHAMTNLSGPHAFATSILTGHQGAATAGMPKDASPETLMMVRLESSPAPSTDCSVAGIHHITIADACASLERRPPSKTPMEDKLIASYTNALRACLQHQQELSTNLAWNGAQSAHERMEGARLRAMAGPADARSVRLILLP